MNRRRRTKYVACLLLFLAASAGPSCITFAQWAKTKPRRARLPTWTTFPDDVFFRDAFRDALQGPPPENSTVASGTSARSVEAGPSSRPVGTGMRWSDVVSARTLEDEVKRLQISARDSLTTQARFTGGAFQQVRRDFAELAMVFAVIARYDGRVRWRGEAATASDLFAQAATKAKVGSVAAYQFAQQRLGDLQDLVRGATLKSAAEASDVPAWSRVCQRTWLMERLETSLEHRLADWTADKARFDKNTEDLRRETEVVKLVSTILRQEGLEDADDEDYADHCLELQQAAEAMRQACESRDQTAAQTALGEIRQSCNRCHDDYRI